MNTSCVFCIIQIEHSEKFVVYEDEDFLAFLDRRPVFHGHTLLIPKNHYETFYDLPKNMVGGLFERVQMLGHAIQQGMGAAGTFIAMNNTISQSVPHLHVHIVPRNKKDGLIGFFWPRRSYKSPAQMQETVEKIQKYITVI